MSELNYYFPKDISNMILEMAKPTDQYKKVLREIRKLKKIRIDYPISSGFEDSIFGKIRKGFTIVKFPVESKYSK